MADVTTVGAAIPFVMTPAERRAFLGSLLTPQLDPAREDERGALEASLRDGTRRCGGRFFEHASPHFCCLCGWNRAAHEDGGRG